MLLGCIERRNMDITELNIVNNVEHSMTITGAVVKMVLEKMC